MTLDELMQQLAAVREKRSAYHVVFEFRYDSVVAESDIKEVNADDGAKIIYLSCIESEEHLHYY